MPWSDIVSGISILLSIFAIWQTNESAKRAELINQQTQQALTEIQSCTKKIETLVGEQQARQIEIIGDATKTMTSTLSQIAMRKDNNKQ